ncbi:MAG: hypothetical protein ACPGNV_02000 [Mangrovicoccus sp.]
MTIAQTMPFTDTDAEETKDWLDALASLAAGEAKIPTHQVKKLNIAALLEFRDRLDFPLSDQCVEALDFYRPYESSAKQRYVWSRRAALGWDDPGVQL